MKRLLCMLTFLALSQLWSGAVGAASIAKAGPACGDTITSDTTLRADLVNCPDNGLLIGADGITLDLHGHTIDGDGVLVDPCEAFCDVGIGNVDGHRDVTIVGGTVKQFGFGVDVERANHNVLNRLTLTDNSLSGLLVFDSSHLRVERNTISRNGLETDFSGIAAFGMKNALMVRNYVANNGDIGLYAEGIDRNRIVHNDFSGNPEAGVLFDGVGNLVSGNRLTRGQDGIIVAGDDNLITRNHILGLRGPDVGYGVSFEGGVGSVLAHNHVARTHWGVRVDAFTGAARNTIIRMNVVLRTQGDGIVVDREAVGPVVGTLVQRNFVTRAGDDGIDVNSPSTTLAGNVAVRNHDLGIEAVPGVTDGGGNHAVSNGDIRQCTNVSC